MSWTTAQYTNISLSNKTLATSDNSIALAAGKSALYVAFKLAGSGSQDIYVATYTTKNGWGTATSTGVSSEWGPALALSGEQLYLFWNEDSDGKVHWGPIDSAGAATDNGAVPNSSTNAGPGAVGSGSALVCGHKGKDLSTKLYAEYYANQEWSSSSKDYSAGASSSYAPAFAATSSQVYMFFQTGMVGVEYTLLDSTGVSGSQLSVLGTLNGPVGAVAFGNGYLVVASGAGAIAYSICNLNDNNTWAYYGACGSNISSSYAPGLAYFGGMVYMVYTASNKQLMWTTLPSAT
jgi:hypothetical protein